MSVSKRVENDTCGSSAICGIWRICGILGTLGVSDACATYVEDVVYDNSMWYMWNFWDIWYNTGISKCCNEPLSIVKIFLIQRSRTGCSVSPKSGSSFSSRLASDLFWLLALDAATPRLANQTRAAKQPSAAVQCLFFVIFEFPKDR